MAALRATDTPAGTTSGAGDAGNPTGPPASALDHGSAAVGHPLPALALQRFDGTDTSLDAYRGTPLVINLWASSCAPCVAEMPDLERVHQANPGVTFLGVDSGESVQLAQPMAAKTGVTYDLALDPTQSVATAVGAAGLPTTVLVRADGTVARVTGPGAVAPDDLQRWIDQDLSS